MAQIFSEWVDRGFVYFGVGAVILALLAVAGAWYFFSPEFTDVGYRPRQPVSFSHKLHAGELRIDCRYCHAGVEISPVASVPPTQTCLNCHRLVSAGSPELELVRESAELDEPIRWVRVHKTPEYAHFNHSIHVNAGIGCSSCHGNVDRMDAIMQAEPLNMAWCLDCHQGPESHIRPLDQVTDTNWSPPEDQTAVARQLIALRGIDPSTDCSACHY